MYILLQRIQNIKQILYNQNQTKNYNYNPINYIFYSIYKYPEKNLELNAFKKKID